MRCHLTAGDHGGMDPAPALSTTIAGAVASSGAEPASRAEGSAVAMGWAQGVTTSLRGGPVLRCSQVWLMSSSSVCSRSKVSFPSVA